MDRARSHRPMTALALGLALSAALTACNRDTQNEAAGDVDRTAPATATANELRVTDVELGRAIGGDKKVTDKTESFKQTDTVYAVVNTAGTATGATLMSRWTFEDGQVVDEFTQSISPTGDAVTEFHISKPGGLPKGKYKVEVFLNGKSIESEEFTVN